MFYDLKADCWQDWPCLRGCNWQTNNVTWKYSSYLLVIFLGFWPISSLRAEVKYHIKTGEDVTVSLSEGQRRASTCKEVRLQHNETIPRPIDMTLVKHFEIVYCQVAKRPLFMNILLCYLRNQREYLAGPLFFSLSLAPPAFWRMKLNTRNKNRLKTYDKSQY